MSPLITLRRRVPLLPRLLLWLMLNLAIVGALIVLQPGSQGLGWNSLLSNPVRERLLDLAQRIAADLATAPATGRQAVLDRATARYGMSFLVQEDGPSPPPESAPSSDRGPFAPDRPPGFTAPPPQGHPPGPPPDQLRTDTDADGAAHARREPPRGPLPGRGPERNASMLAAAITIEHPYPFDHWRVRIPAALAATSEPTGPPPRPIMLTAETTHFWSLLGFLGVARGSGLLLAAIGISLALWWLFAWDITRTVSAINHATQRIAEGRFDVRIATRRRDELGDLADAVNRMAVKLERQYADQRAFVADVAHEITSPLARLQMGLGVLETRLAPEIRSALDDVRDDVEQMAAMLDELLMFSRAGLAAGRPAEVVAVRPIALAALAQENAADAVRLTIDDHWIVRAHAPLLQRALANLIRNALRYAGHETGSIELVAEAAGNQAMALIVQDRGPGVAAKVLPRLGEPFYRPDAARTRDTGGHGLGLAIVRRCIEACDGEVSFANREGGGFEARLLLATVR